MGLTARVAECLHCFINTSNQRDMINRATFCQRSLFTFFSPFVFTGTSGEQILAPLTAPWSDTCGPCWKLRCLWTRKTGKMRDSSTFPTAYSSSKRAFSPLTQTHTLDNAKKKKSGIRVKSLQLNSLHTSQSCVTLVVNTARKMWEG